MKAASSPFTPLFTFGLVSYGAGAGLWLIILRLHPLSMAFPIASGALMVGTTLVSVYFLKEAVSPLQVFGIILIGGGIVVIATA